MNILSLERKHIPEVIQLLEQSLGNKSTQKSEAFFCWKHLDNPFGKSKVLLAMENNAIVGIRAFMNWQWACQTNAIMAVRAVDTVSHPAHRGKGIFQKLTMQAVSEAKYEGAAIVFNSPNRASEKGYLKMGWQVAGRMPFYLGAGVFFPAKFTPDRCDQFYKDYHLRNALSQLSPAWSLPVTGTKWHTQLNYEYLIWRYSNCPVASYGGVIEPGKFGFIFRLKKIKQFAELRICEAWLEPGFDDDGRFKASISQVIDAVRPAFVSVAPSPYLQKYPKIGRLALLMKLGPVITVRPLDMQNITSFRNFNQWSPSIGSMELF